MLVPITLILTIEGRTQSQAVATLDKETGEIAWEGASAGLFFEGCQRITEARLLKHFSKMPDRNRVKLNGITMYAGTEESENHTVFHIAS